ncbi:DUF397 domain-containing protein [Saccharopolyspora erythraea]|uniref:DUF397 domain-containing protein n=1 Tax=Saccharopolyspora erythraea TaxID=1836 RepID=UPI001BA9F6E8|nr:DUF397 domain-containing protein [Saccharopolyspora erythraea]QUH01395.1 DUF397 domain-containing protein [Saccharopolyspora erythraea]
MSDLARAEWRKSSRSGGNGGQCVEVAVTPTTVGVRDTKDRAGGTLVLSARCWAGFVSGVRDGRFDA